MKPPILGVIQFSTLGYNLNNDKCVLFVSYMCGGECGTWDVYLVEKKERWEIAEIYNVAIS